MSNLTTSSPDSDRILKLAASKMGSRQGTGRICDLDEGVDLQRRLMVSSSEQVSSGPASDLGFAVMSVRRSDDSILASLVLLHAATAMRGWSAADSSVGSGSAICVLSMQSCSGSKCCTDCSS